MILTLSSKFDYQDDNRDDNCREKNCNFLAIYKIL